MHAACRASRTSGSATHSSAVRREPQLASCIGGAWRSLRQVAQSTEHNGGKTPHRIRHACRGGCAVTMVACVPLCAALLLCWCLRWVLCTGFISLLFLLLFAMLVVVVVVVTKHQPGSVLLLLLLGCCVHQVVEPFAGPSQQGLLVTARGWDTRSRTRARRRLCLRG